MQIPLEKRLKKRMHVEIAALQDEVMEILYGIDNDLVLHGGTAIWRCYGGNRFSEDLDLYCRNSEKIELRLRQTIESRGLTVQKFKKTKNLIFMKISGGQTEIRVEINFSVFKKPVARPYERTDGTFMNVLTLSEEDLVIEKISAYEQRLFIRDIYDIYHLSNYVKDNAAAVAKIRNFLETIEQPVDEKNIRILVYAGAVPTFAQMAEFLKRRFS